MDLSEGECGLDLEGDELRPLLNHQLKLLRIAHLPCITRIERPKRKMPLRRKKGTDPLAIRLKDEISRSEQPLPLNEGVNDDPCHYHLQRHKS